MFVCLKVFMVVVVPIAAGTTVVVKNSILQIRCAFKIVIKWIITSQK